MSLITESWDTYKSIVEDTYSEINTTIGYLTDILNGVKKVGRKVTDNEFENRFNRVVFEVQLFYFMQWEKHCLSNEKLFLNEFKKLSSNDVEFRSSIESSTKNIESYRNRYSKFQELVNRVYSLDIDINPFK